MCVTLATWRPLTLFGLQQASGNEGGDGSDEDERAQGLGRKGKPRGRGSSKAPMYQLIAVRCHEGQ